MRHLRSALQYVGAVQSVALRGHVAGILNDAAEFAFIRAVAYAGGEDHVFLNQDAAYIVGAELQTQLADLDSRRKPARLDVIDVVEVEAADGQGLQVIDGGGLRDFLSERSVVRREHPWNERGEAAGIFLYAAQALEVIDAVAVLLAAAEHHGGGGAHAERVS